MKIETETCMRVGGTHTALLSSASPALAGGLPPVCRKSPRKGQIKVRAKGHNTASTCSKAATHLTEYICEERKKKIKHITLVPSAAIDRFLQICRFLPVS